MALPPVIDTAPCGFLSFANDGTVTAANATLLAELGYAAEDVVGSHVETLMTVSSRVFYQTHFFPLLRLEGRVEEVYLTLRRANGETQAVLVNAAQRLRDGIVANDCVMLNLRQRQKWEDEIMRAKRAAEEASRAKSDFLSMVSHDLRTPLNAIAGYAELIAMGIRGPVTEEQRSDLARIKTASAFLLSLLNDVLSFARLEAGQLEIRAEPVQLEDALQAAEALVQPQLTAAGLSYAREPCPPVVVKADSERLQQILLNLLTNAVKFTPAGGEVTLGCELLSDFAIIRVRDTGPGIPADQCERIFEPFVQIPGAASKAGVGLGLAISRQLARAMGGELSVESELGHGATFTLSVPLADAGR